MLSCQRATELLSQAQEEPLSWSTRLSLRFHVSMCSGCRQFGRQMIDLRSFAKQYSQQGDSSEADERDPN